MSHILGTYMREKNDAKHRYIDILLEHGACVPPEVTPPILALHRGDVRQLGTLLDQDPGLLNRCFRDLPYGNITLRGGTLLHCAVEFGEHACIVELLKRGSDINAKAKVIDGIGGQTPIFHALAINYGRHLGTLNFLVSQAGKAIDLSVRATWRRTGEVQSNPMTPLEYVEAALGVDAPEWKRTTPGEVRLLRELAQGS